MKISTSRICILFTIYITVVSSAVISKSTPVPSELSEKSSVTSTSSSLSSSKLQKTSPPLPPASASSTISSVKTKDTSTPSTTTKGGSSVSDTELDKLLLDRRYLSRQLKCALGEGVCDPVGRRLKSFAPLVLRGSCPQCTPAETRQIQKVLSHVQRNYPKEWAKIIQQFTGNRK